MEVRKRVRRLITVQMKVSQLSVQKGMGREMCGWQKQCDLFAVGERINPTPQWTFIAHAHLRIADPKFWGLVWFCVVDFTVWVSFTCTTYEFSIFVDYAPQEVTKCAPYSLCCAQHPSNLLYTQQILSCHGRHCNDSSVTNDHRCGEVTQYLFLSLQFCRNTARCCQVLCLEFHKAAVTGCPAGKPLSCGRWRSLHVLAHPRSEEASSLLLQDGDPCFMARCWAVAELHPQTPLTCTCRCPSVFQARHDALTPSPVQNLSDFPFC